LGFGGSRTDIRKEAFLVPVSSRSSDSLEAIIKEYVLTRSVIHTDLWKGYAGLDKRLGFSHRTVNHSLFFSDPETETGTHTNTIEGTWSGVKINILRRNRVEDYMEDHLFEFIWRRVHENDL